MHSQQHLLKMYGSDPMPGVGLQTKIRPIPLSPRSLKLACEMHIDTGKGDYKQLHNKDKWYDGPLFSSATHPFGKLPFPYSITGKVPITVVHVSGPPSGDVTFARPITAPYSPGLSDGSGMAHGPNLTNQNHSLGLQADALIHAEPLNWDGGSLQLSMTILSFCPPLHGGTTSVVGKSEGSPREMKG